MNKNKIGAVIAGVSIAGAFGVKLYSQYKLLKSDDEQETESNETTKEASNVSDQDLNDFEFDSILEENEGEVESEDEIKMETVDPENDPLSDINSLFEAKVESIVPNNDNVVSINEDSTTESPTNNATEETKKEENYDSSMSKYKNMDINDPACWADFDKEIEDDK